MTKELTIGEIRIELHKLQNKVREMQGKSKLSNQYLSKVSYMLMWFRLLPLEKNVISNWHMPDYTDIAKLRRIKK